MNVALAIEQLTRNPTVVSAQVQNVMLDQARWKPTPDAWSILEVINHLFDEERRDFRVRLDYTLNKPNEEWPPIDPEQWVVDEQYNERELATSLENYQAERRKSLAWLAELDDVDWSTGRKAPWGGVMRAGDLLAAWAAHDLLHIRQLNELQYAYVKKEAEPYSPEYAGAWG